MNPYVYNATSFCDAVWRNWDCDNTASVVINIIGFVAYTGGLLEILRTIWRKGIFRYHSAHSGYRKKRIIRVLLAFLCVCKLMYFTLWYINLKSLILLSLYILSSSFLLSSFSILVLILMDTIRITARAPTSEIAVVGTRISIIGSNIILWAGNVAIILLSYLHSNSCWWRDILRRNYGINYSACLFLSCWWFIFYGLKLQCRMRSLGAQGTLAQIVLRKVNVMVITSIMCGTLRLCTAIIDYLVEFLGQSPFKEFLDAHPCIWTVIADIIPDLGLMIVMLYLTKQNSRHLSVNTLPTPMPNNDRGSLPFSVDPILILKDHMISITEEGNVKSMSSAIGCVGTSPRQIAGRSQNESERESRVYNNRDAYGYGSYASIKHTSLLSAPSCIEYQNFPHHILIDGVKS